MHPIDLSNYLGLVHYVARRAHRRVQAAGVGLDDLLQAGYLGLLEAARRYDPTHGAPFVAYARPRIAGAILDLLGTLDPLSKRERRAQRELEAAEADLTGRLGRPPTAAELAEALATTPSEVVRIRARGLSLMSLDAEPDWAGREPAGDTPPPDSTAAREELARAVGECLEVLTPESQVVAIGRLLDDVTLEALATLLRSSKDRIWRLERRARRALRTCLEGKGWNATDAIAAAQG